MSVKCCSGRCFGLLLSALGAALSAYALYVEIKAESEPDYKALCDIDDTISCSRVFNSRWGKGFGFVGPLTGLSDSHWAVQKNPVYGLVFYGLMALLCLCNVAFFARLQFYLSIAANLMSVYLGYVLYFELKGLCVVCVSTYVVNFFLLIASWCKLRHLRAANAEARADRVNRLPTTSKADFKKNI